jgi:hypothetical protein
MNAEERFVPLVMVESVACGENPVQTGSPIEL